MKANISDIRAKVLKELRDVLVKKKNLQTQLDAVVTLLAKRLGVGVCSCYLARPGDVLELYATYGLDKAAVHETFLRLGEGLIGEIAFQKKLLVFADAWAHPSFVHKPATKEQKFKSLMGAPILYKGQLLGVLAVQTEKVMVFPDEMQELLTHVALILAEVLGGHAVKKQKKIEAMRGHRKLEGAALVEGLAIGQAFIHTRADRFSEILAKNPKNELKRIQKAFETMEKQVRGMMQKACPAEETGIIESYLKFTQDKGWRDKINAFIDKGFTAEVAVKKVLEDITDRMEKMPDAFLKEKIHDFQDLSDRLIRHLKGKEKDKRSLPPQTILVAQSLGPAELLDYDLTHIKGLILQEASQTMHVVIVARSLNIPVVSLGSEWASITQEDEVAVDGINGVIYVNPEDEILDKMALQLKEQQGRQEFYAAQRLLPSVTQDGFAVSLNANVGLPTDILSLQKGDYEGVGLYRTELPFLTSKQLPDLEEQTKIYQTALQTFGNKPVYFRTLDIGSDKVLPYFDNHGEQNPALGWRSIRITLDRRSLLREQLRAFIRATAGKDLYVMFPMIADIDEFVQARQTLDVELNRARLAGEPLPRQVRVGTMLEVPALLFQLPALLPLVDFVSVGTNDLMQFLFAVDRGNPAIWGKYDMLSPALLKALKQIQEACEKAKVPCCVCGEMAGKPLEAFVLIGLGFNRLSMAPASLGAVKAVLRTMNQAKTADYLARILSRPEHSLRDRVRSYALDQGVFI